MAKTALGGEGRPLPLQSPYEAHFRSCRIPRPPANPVRSNTPVAGSGTLVGLVCWWGLGLGGAFCPQPELAKPTRAKRLRITIDNVPFIIATFLEALLLCKNCPPRDCAEVRRVTRR